MLNVFCFNPLCSRLHKFSGEVDLASLATCLIEEGNSVRILDFNKPSVLSEIIPIRTQKTLEKIGNKVFRDKIRPGFSDIARLKLAGMTLEKQKRIYCNGLKKYLLDVIERDKIDFLGMKLWAGEGFAWCMEIGRFLKEKHPELKIFGGGPQVDIFGAGIFKTGGFFDALCYGEGEETIVRLAKFTENKDRLESIPNLFFKQNGDIRKTNRKYITDLNSLPIPTYDPQIYADGGQKIKMLVIDESRGCPNNCFFCIHPVKNGKRRAKSAERIVKELSLYKTRYGVSLFRYGGSNTPGKLLQQTAEQILNNELKIKYTSFGSVSECASIDLDILKKSGCESLFFGVESVNEKILREGMNKKFSKDLTQQVLHQCKSCGIFTVVSMIYPAPFEDRSTRNESMEFLKTVRPDSTIVQFAGLFPNTVWFQQAKRFNFGVNAETYPEKVMTYQIKALFPPRFWDPLPYKINGMKFKEYACETENFQKELKEAGLQIGISDEAYLLYLFTEYKSLDEFLNLNRFFFFSFQSDELKKEIRTVNRKSEQL